MYKIILKTAVTALVLFSATVTIGSEIPGVTSSAYKESSAYPADDSAVITGDALISTAMKAPPPTVTATRFTGTGTVTKQDLQ